jgi:hypothetical protein
MSDISQAKIMFTYQTRAKRRVAAIAVDVTLVRDEVELLCANNEKKVQHLR